MKIISRPAKQRGFGTRFRNQNVIHYTILRVQILFIEFQTSRDTNIGSIQGHTIISSVCPTL